MVSRNSIDYTFKWKKKKMLTMNMSEKKNTKGGS